jgi:dolichol kinase
MSARSLTLPRAGTPAGELAGALLVVVLILAILGLAELWRRRGGPPDEWTRKLVHVGSGAVVGLFPWIFRSPWTVLALGLFFAGVIAGARRLGLLRGIHCVERRSEGDVYFLVAACLLFVIGRHRPVFYLIAVLVLMLADTAAALVGSRYGRWTYAVGAGRRSFEGSAVFFVTAFLGVHVPLLLLTEVDPAASLLISLQVALLAACFEAISLRGNDNLIVPLVTYYLLVKMTPYSAEWIALQILLQVTILGLAALAAWRTRLLSASGAVAAHLFFYGALALGGPAWLAAPALALAGLCLMRRLHAGRADRAGSPHQVAAVFYAGITATLLFLLDNSFQTLLTAPAWLAAGDPLYVLFVGAVAGQAALAILPHLERRGPARGTGFAASLAGFGLVAPAGLWLGPCGLTLLSAGTGAAVCFGGMAVYGVGSRMAGVNRGGAWDLRIQAASVAAAAALALPLYLWGSGGR